jgi:hypothetical protein
MAAERSGFIRTQYAFAASIRDPEHAAIPAGVEQRRMAVYRELFYNNVEGFLSGTFPVLRKILDDERWHALVRDYFSRHRARSPLFLEMPREFLAYLENERGDLPGDPPFLRELAHYEWVELALSIAEERCDAGGIAPNGDLLDQIPVLSPLAWHLSYRFPVHRVGPEYQPLRAGETPTLLVVYRNRRDEVGFLEINAVTKRLLELMDERTHATGISLLMLLAEELKHPDPQVVIGAGRDVLERLRALDIIQGTRAIRDGPAPGSPPRTG